MRDKSTSQECHKFKAALGDADRHWVRLGSSATLVSRAMTGQACAAAAAAAAAGRRRRRRAALGAPRRCHTLQPCLQGVAGPGEPWSELKLRPSGQEAGPTSWVKLLVPWMARDGS